ncbi:hypothetical protein LIER_19996 [Lithospermum erythrorhizon]|uniref:Uncharacterized protein n=1 Tax=Lithospermum erythrorhizon TaxID=34254 RepID=A0AAV3QKX3_LITER
MKTEAGIWSYVQDVYDMEIETINESDMVNDSNEILEDVERAPVESTITKLSVETPSNVIDNPWVQNLQHGNVVEDENKTSFEELNDLKINIVNEYESLIMTVSYATYYDDNLVSPDKCRNMFLEDYLFSFATMAMEEAMED